MRAIGAERGRLVARRSHGLCERTLLQAGAKLPPEWRREAEDKWQREKEAEFRQRRGWVESAP